MNQDLKQYVETEILPMYDGFDAAHRLDHAMMVIEQSLRLAAIVNLSPDYTEPDGTKTRVDEDMVYAIAAYHDTGLTVDRKTHHTESARIIRSDSRLRQWFAAEQIEIMADAAADHRASAKSAPRSVYGMIVAEADRHIDPLTIIRRTVQYGLANYPELDKEGHYRRALEHMHEKYAEGGYLRLWIPESPNGERLASLRRIIRDENQFRECFEQCWNENMG